MIITEPFKSKSSDKTYLAAYDTDTGQAVCGVNGVKPCMGWLIQKKDQNGNPRPRECDHTKRMLAKYASGAPILAVAPEPVAKPAINFIDPMKASGAGDLGVDRVRIEDYTSPQWAMEQKIDGHRIIVHVNGQIIAYSKVGNTRPLPAHILECLKKLPKGIYDGELFVPGGKSSDVVRLDRAKDLLYAIFDVLEFEGQDCKIMPYVRRRDLLGAISAAHMEYLDPVGVLLSGPVSKEGLERIWANGGEGAVLKRVTSLYYPGRRSPDWVKLKKEAQTVAVIAGFMAGKNGPYSRVRVIENGREFDVKTLDADHLRLFASNPQAYVGRQLVISYNERLSSGALRHPMFDHLVAET